MLLDELFIPPNKAQIEIIKEELKEDTERFEHNLKLLEQWMNSQPHLPTSYDKQMLAIYLRGCKHDMAKTKKKSDLLAMTKFTNEEMPICDNIFGLTLQKLTQDGARIVLIKMIDSSLDLFNISIMLRKLWKLAQLRIYKEKMISGDYYIIDCANLKPIHMSKIINKPTQKTVFVGLNAYFSRIKGIHFINCPSYAEKTLNIFKLLLPYKIRNSVIAEVTFTGLLEYLPKECLPRDYSGTEMSCEELGKIWQQCLEENEDWFNEWEQLKLVGPVPKDLRSKCVFDDEF